MQLSAHIIAEIANTKRVCHGLLINFDYDLFATN